LKIIYISFEVMSKLDSFRSGDNTNKTESHSQWKRLPVGSFQTQTVTSFDELKAKMAQGRLRQAVLTQQGLWVKSQPESILSFTFSN
jgi:hypothetical protein